MRARRAPELKDRRWTFPAVYASHRKLARNTVTASASRNIAAMVASISRVRSSSRSRTLAVQRASESERRAAKRLLGKCYSLSVRADIIIIEPPTPSLLSLAVRLLT